MEAGIWGYSPVWDGVSSDGMHARIVGSSSEPSSSEDQQKGGGFSRRGTVSATAGREVRLKDAGIDAQRVKSWRVSSLGVDAVGALLERCLRRCVRCVGIVRIRKESPGWFEMGSSLPLECLRDQRSLPVGSGASAARRIPGLFIVEKEGKETERVEALIGESSGTYCMLGMVCGGRCGC